MKTQNTEIAALEAKGWEVSTDIGPCKTGYIVSWPNDHDCDIIHIGEDDFCIYCGAMLTRLESGQIVAVRTPYAKTGSRKEK